MSRAAPDRTRRRAAPAPGGMEAVHPLKRRPAPQHLVGDVEVRVRAARRRGSSSPSTSRSTCCASLPLEADRRLRHVWSPSADWIGTPRASAPAGRPSRSCGVAVISKTESARRRSAAPASSASPRSSSSSTRASPRTWMIPLRSNIQPTEPTTSPRLPLNFVNVCRISGAARFLFVGQHLDHDGDPARPVPLVGDLLVGLARQLAGPLLDGALEGVGGHVDRLRLSIAVLSRMFISSGRRRSGPRS